MKCTGYGQSKNNRNNRSNRNNGNRHSAGGSRSRPGFRALLAVFFVSSACLFPGAAGSGQRAAGSCPASVYAAGNGTEDVLIQYREYRERLEGVETAEDISADGFRIIENQIFPIEMTGHGEVSVIPALDEAYSRLALFFADGDGRIIYRTDQLETNNRVTGQMKQPNRNIAAIVFQDLNRDGRMDIVLLTTCVNVSGGYAGKPYRVGDVLFQSGQGTGFYRDYRITDKINRFGMNKNTELITAFVRDGCSTEFLYTSETLEELLDQGLDIITEQSHARTFGKLGKLQVVPGVYHVASFDIFMVYLVNEQGDIVSSLQPMGNYDNLYALKGINCKDIDGDGLKDIVILAKYSYENDAGEIIVDVDYSIYYQRTGGFSADTDIKKRYQCGENDTMEMVVERARAYWGWRSEDA